MTPGDYRRELVEAAILLESVHGAVYDAAMTLTEAATALSVDASTLRHQIKSGKLRARKVGPVWTVSPAEVERYRAESLGRAGRPVGMPASPPRGGLRQIVGARGPALPEEPMSEILEAAAEAAKG